MTIRPAGAELTLAARHKDSWTWRLRGAFHTCANVPKATYVQNALYLKEFIFFTFYKELQ